MVCIPPSCPPDGDIAAVSESTTEGQGVCPQAKHGAWCPLSTRRRPAREAAGLSDQPGPSFNKS